MSPRSVICRYVDGIWSSNGKVFHEYRCSGRVDGEGDSVAGKRADADSRQATPEGADTLRAVELTCTVAHACVSRIGWIVALQAALDDVNGDVDEPGGGAGETSREEHRVHVARLLPVLAQVPRTPFVDEHVGAESGNFTEDGDGCATKHSADSTLLEDIVKALHGSLVH